MKYFYRFTGKMCEQLSWHKGGSSMQCDRKKQVTDSSRNGAEFILSIKN